MLATLRKSPEQLQALNRVEAWTRARFALHPEASILVSELACGLPGCPPLETVVAFWTSDAGANAQPQRHCFKLFKPAREVSPDDLPYAWLKPALTVSEGYDYDCC